MTTKRRNLKLRRKLQMTKNKAVSMTTGKISEISYKRAILKKMNKVSEGVKPGVDAATISLEDVTVVMSSNCVLKWFSGCEKYWLQKTVNCLKEKAGTPKAIQLEINIPEKFEEKLLGKIVANFNTAAKEKSMPVIQCRTYKGQVEGPIAHITVIGETRLKLESKNVKPGMDVVMAGTAGVGGISIIAKENLDKIKAKFSNMFVLEAMELEKMTSVENAADIAMKYSPAYMHNISDGGVFGAVWEIGSASNKGINVDARKIPIWQHTVEIAELFDINPYLLEGSGGLLIVCENGEDLVNELLENNIPSAIIGSVTDNNDKTVLYGDEVRYLEPPRGDELYKYL